MVYNLSSHALSEDAINSLAKGFNFAIAPTRIPVESIICGVESAVSNLDTNSAEAIRQDVSQILRTARPPKRNLPYKEEQALKELRRNEDIIILPADKGNATVIMDSNDYHRKIETLLDDPSYQRITTDPTTYLEKTTKTKIQSCPIDKVIQNQLIPREKSSRCPKLYGLPKIHKEGAPLRPIVSSIGSPLQELARYLARKLQPHTEKMKSYVKNADHLIELLKTETVEPEHLLVSFDVVSLFTNIPVDEALQIIRQKYQPEEHIIDLIKHCLKNTYFSYNDKRYRQIEGAPMGSPLSPVIANLFMEDIEVRALESTTLKPKLWLRYVDDTFVIWTHGRNKLDEFLSHLNNIHSKIQFTMEVESLNQLPFLDVLLKKKPDGKLGHTVYRKATHTDRYLHATSHHHPAQLHSVIKTLTTRSKRLADEENMNKEMGFIQKALMKNGYTQKAIQQSLRPPKPKNEEISEEPKGKAYLPYVKGTTDKISNILRKHKIDTIFKTDKKISNVLRNAKKPIPLEAQGVYEIPCLDCNKSYVGQTNRRISVRKQEHVHSVRNHQTTSSLFQHMKATGHSIDFDNTKMLANIEHYKSRTIREAIEIEKRPQNLNKRDDTQRLPPAWKPALATRQTKTDQPSSKSPQVISEEVTQRGPMTRSRTQNQRSATNHDHLRVFKEQLGTAEISSVRATRSSNKPLWRRT